MRKIKFLAVLSLIFIMTSCSGAVENAADEIRLNEWSARLKCGYDVKLSFKDDNAEFKILSKNKNSDIRLNGLCFIDRCRIMIFDSSDKDSYVFLYKLSDNKLSLKYDGGKIVLTRV